MSNNTNNLLVEQEEVERSPIKRYLQDPLSNALAKLVTLFQATPSFTQPHPIENARFEQYEFHPGEQHLYNHFTDRVDPSLYYTLFFPFHHY